MGKISDNELIEELKARLNSHKQTIAELNLVSDELRIINAKLEDSEALKSHFISHITNELINPFASIMALSREILELKNKHDWNKVETMVSLIHTETFHLDFQLRNIFAAASIEAGEAIPEISRVNVTTLINNTIDIFAIECSKKNIEIKPIFTSIDNKEIEFNTDPAKLKLILINFLSNSVKFSNIKSTITIKTSIKDSHLEITLADNGIGIPKEFQDEMFDRFKRSDNAINSINRGNGLGLSINKAFVDLLGGVLDFESTLGVGTTFKITIPENNMSINAYSDGGNDFFFDDELVI
ncbi:MAG: HAMP domain-containing histidine kinase [Bacteroidales bacterium]|nr:HAMP domain-containing histidine kinase [Bacteroidales bacterium]